MVIPSTHNYPALAPVNFTMSHGSVPGWNDCPPMMLSNNNSSTSLSKGRKKYHRVLSLASLASDTSLSDSPGVPSRDITPRTPLTSPQANAALSPKDSPKDIVSVKELTQSCTNLLANLFAKPSTLPEHEMNHFKSKLLSNCPKELNHLQFLHSILSKSDSKGIDKEILNYMVVNSGVSAWCLPLKKVISGII